MEQSIQVGATPGNGSGSVITSPIAIEPIMQKSSADCGVAALAMYLGLPYRTVSEVALNLIPDVMDNGMTRSETIEIAKSLSAKLKRSRKIDFGLSHGLLFLERGRAYHFVVLFKGLIINPADGLLWDPDAYLNQTGYKAVTLLYIKD